MSKWLALARTSPVPIVPLVPKTSGLVPDVVAPGNSGTNGTIGTGHSHSVEPQIDTFRCFVCHLHDTAEKPLVPVLSGIPAHPHHWLHADCWPEHARRCQQAREATR